MNRATEAGRHLIVLKELVAAYEQAAPYMPEHLREDLLKKLIAIRDDLGDELNILKIKAVCNV